MKPLTRKDVEALLNDKPVCLDKKKVLYIIEVGCNTVQLYQEGFAREGFADKIEGYCVNNPSLWGKEVFGKKCVTPDSLKGRNDVLVLICTFQPKYYANMPYCRLIGEYPDHDLITENQYFCWADFTNKDIGTTFVDCGAYVGDSLERYVWHKDGVVDKILAFEPDSNNYRAMQYRIERLKNEWNLTG